MSLGVGVLHFGVRGDPENLVTRGGNGFVETRLDPRVPGLSSRLVQTDTTPTVSGKEDGLSSE